MYSTKSLSSLASATIAVVLALAGSGQAQTINVSSSAELQRALTSVADGGVVELASGTYNAPSGGFTIYAPKAFTVRAALRSTVVISGGGVSDILRLANGTVGTGRAVRFERLTFRDGFNTRENFIGGGVTLVNTEAIFVDCEFTNNAAEPSTTGGGALWVNNAVVALNGCTFRNNRSKNYGGAISALDARVFVTGSQFIGNSVNQRGHIPNSAGGAIFVNSSLVRIANSRFEDNSAGYVGGAIYALGGWKSRLEQPTAEVVVSDSLFLRNTATRDASVQFSAPAVGGAIHVEDQTTGRFVNCRFLNNSARQGGALSSYRAHLDIQGSIFKANQATGTGNAEGIGGTIIALSFDGIDETTNYGRLDRRSASVAVSDSYFEGSGGVDGRQGGAIFSSGDLNSAYGFGGVTPDGTAPEGHRGLLTLNGVVFSNFRVQEANGTPGTGGAVMGDFVDVSATDILIDRCSASDYAGGMEFIQGSNVVIKNSTIAQTQAGSLGAGITMFGGHLEVSGSRFLGNRVADRGMGAAITTSPDTSSGARPPVDMTGFIENCTFSDNGGGPTIYDGDSVTAPFNRLQYRSNRFFPNESAFYSDVTGESSGTGLNSVVIDFRGRTATIKGISNTGVTAAPDTAVVMMVPEAVAQGGAPGETLPVPSYVAFAWSGQTATLNGTTLSPSSGTVEATTEEPQNLEVGTASVSTVSKPGAAVNISTRLPVGTDSNVLIGGFIVQGSAAKRVIVRALGPSLAAGGVSGVLQDPVLEIYDGGGSLIASNNNWRTTDIGGALVKQQATEIEASSVFPANDAEAAVILDLLPDAYTAVVRGAGNTVGIALVEVYDLSSGTASSLANISTRGFIQTGENVMIGGFIYGGGPAATRVLIRALGPSLAAAGVANPLPDPTLELFDANGVSIATNDDWKTSQAREIESTGLQPASELDAVLLMNSLPRAAYTAVVRGKGGATGVGIVEAYVFQ